MITIWIDMDGTIANLYAVKNWLPMLRAFDETPYAEAKPLPHMATLARLLNRVQAYGYRIAILSALSKDSTVEYDRRVIQAKMQWLKKHLPSVQFDEMRFVPYDYIKNNANNGADILFDDEQRHLDAWTSAAFPAKDLINILKILR